MTKQVSDFLLERLSQWGVKRIYGYPGDGINGILGGLERHLEQFEFIQVRHEETAALRLSIVHPSLVPLIASWYQFRITDGRERGRWIY